MPGERASVDLSFLILLTVLGVLLFRSAWVCDEAYVTLRTLEHALSGHGLRFNPDERVQGFIHPLWAAWLALPYALTREPWLTTMVVSGLTTLFACNVLAYSTAREPWSGGLALVGLISSKAWVDHATAGLEEPLMWLGLALLVRELYREEGPREVLILEAALVGLIRLDALLLVVPAVLSHGLVQWRMGERSSLLRSQLGWLPLLAWHGFALLYYGSLLPSPALAALSAGIGPWAHPGNALAYFEWTLQLDPATLPLIGLGLVSGLVQRNIRGLSCALGLVLYLLFVIWLGGAPLGGRWLATPLWFAIALISASPWRPIWAVVVSTIALSVSLMSPHAPLRAGPATEPAPAAHGIVDPRAVARRATSLFTASGLRGAPAPSGGARVSDPVVVIARDPGRFGYDSGPGVHVVDPSGRTDPLLARLSPEQVGRTGMGPFPRRLPEGYELALASGGAGLERPDLESLYAQIQLATRAPLWAPGRWRALLALNSGAASGQVDPSAWRYPEVTWAHLGEAPYAVPIGGLGLWIEGRSGRLALELSETRWTVIAERGRRRQVFRIVPSGGSVTIPLSHTDWVLLLPDAPGTARAALVPGP